MSIESGSRESGNSEDPVVKELKQRLQNLHEVGGKTEKAAAPRLQKMLERIDGGDKNAYEEAANEFALNDQKVQSGEVKLEKKKGKKLSEEETREIEKIIDRFD